MTQLDLRSTELHPTADFESIDARFIESLNVRLEHYRHKKTGAEHFHLASDKDENVFMVALRTMPKDSSGVAHILEHTALCGSEKYPVRDPFFMMTRRSLNTFMNAMTSSDWTAYPFASENAKDYENLLSVYLDAVFFSKLEELDFKQEGHRLEFETVDDSSSPLQFKGVVFNEMKGAMSSPVSQLYQSFKSYLFPSNTYHFNSGGDPEHIPDLTYEQLKSFYKTHYHPSNATFFTFGNRPAQDIQQRIQSQALAKFEPLPSKLSVPLEKRFNRKLRVEEAYPFEGDTKKQTYLSMGWLLGESTDLFAQLEAHLLSDLLLDNSASPLRQALETSELGTSPSPLCGLDDSNREMVFMAGLEGSEPERADAFEKLIMDTLTSVAENGVSDEEIEAVLHQLELSQREITGDSYPYGLQLIFSVTGAATHGGSVMDSLDIDAALERLREATKQLNYIQDLAKRLLIDNQHCVRICMRPDTQYKQQQLDNERKRLDYIQARLTEAEKQAIIEQSSALKQRQESVDDSSVLPKVTLQDVKPEVSRYTPIKESPIITYVAGTNGLAYQQWYWPIPSLTVEERRLLPLYTSLLPELGAGTSSYLDMQKLQAAKTGNVNLYSMYKPSLEDSDAVNGYLVLSGKALERNNIALTDIMKSHWLDARFDETSRVLELLSLMSSRRVQGITGSGHSLAMQASSASQSLGSALIYDVTGLPGIRRLKEWIAAWGDDKAQLNVWLEGLKSLHAKFQAQSAHALLVTEAHRAQEIEKQIIDHAIPFSAESFSDAQDLTVFKEPKIVWSAETQVNFCSAAYRTVPANHEDSAALTVLGGVLRNNYLHRTIREQGGAYGGGASHDNSNGVFRFYSYRDPRLEETLADFTGSIEWLKSGKLSEEHIEEAILGVISSLDKPGSPAGEVKGAYQNRLFKRTDDVRKAYRERILGVTKDQLVGLADVYFNDENRSEAVVTDAKKAAALHEKGFDWQKI